MNLERCGDLARNIAKRSLVLSESEPLTPLARPIERMGRLVGARLKEVLDAIYRRRALEKAAGVWARDEEVDEHYNSLFRELLTYMMGDPRTITPGAHLLFIAKNSRAHRRPRDQHRRRDHPFRDHGVSEMTGERP